MIIALFNMNLFNKRFLKSPSGILLALWLSIFLGSTIVLISGHKGFFLRLVNSSFFLLFLGVVIYVLESQKNAKD